MAVSPLLHPFTTPHILLRILSTITALACLVFNILISLYYSETHLSVYISLILVLLLDNISILNLVSSRRSNYEVDYHIDHEESNLCGLTVHTSLEVLNVMLWVSTYVILALGIKEMDDEVWVPEVPGGMWMTKDQIAEARKPAYKKRDHYKALQRYVVIGIIVLHVVMLALSNLENLMHRRRHKQHRRLRTRSMRMVSRDNSSYTVPTPLPTPEIAFLQQPTMMFTPATPSNPTTPGETELRAVNRSMSDEDESSEIGIDYSGRARLGDQRRE